MLHFYIYIGNERVSIHLRHFVVVFCLNGVVVYVEHCAEYLSWCSWTAVI